MKTKILILMICLLVLPMIYATGYGRPVIYFEAESATNYTNSGAWNGYHQALSSGSLQSVPGKVGNAWLCSGDKLANSTSPDPTGILTINFWINATIASGQQVFSWTQASNHFFIDSPGYMLVDGLNYAAFDWNNGTQKWTMVTYTSNGVDNTTVYINDALARSTPDARVLNDVGNFILCSNEADNANYNGAIDNWAMFNYTFNDSAVIAAYNESAGTFYNGDAWTLGAAPADPTPLMNVTIIQPLADTGIGLADLTLDSNIWINVSFNQTNATCSLNDTKWSYNSNTSSVYLFNNNTAISNGKYSILANCSDPGDALINGTNTTFFTVDNSPPDYSPLITLSNNRTIVWNNSLHTQINFTDDLEIYSINVTFSNGTEIYGVTSLGDNHYELNISYGVNPTPTDYLDIRVCDAHTKEEIKDIKRIDKYNNGFNYVINDNPLWLEDDYITIYPENYLFYYDPKTDKLNDRYTFEFNKFGILENKETFIVKSNNYIDIIENSKYDGHLVIPALDRWIDFENPESSKVDIKRISDTEVRVDVYGLKSNKMLFSSVGELNCVNTTYWYNNLNPTTTYTSGLLIGATDTITLNITADPNILTSSSASLSYNGTLYNDTTYNFSALVTAPSSVDGNDDNVTFRWILTANGVPYNLTLFGQNVSDFAIDNCSTYTTTILNVSIRNNTNENLINASLEYTFEYTNGQISKNYSNAVVTDYETFCIYPPFGSITSDIQFEYVFGGNTYNQFYNDLALNNLTINRTLYVSGGASIVEFTVTDETDTLLPDAYIEIQEYDVGTGSYITTEIIKTGSDGVALGNIILDTVWYRFVIKYAGTTYLTTEKQKITATTKKFQIIIGTIPELIILKLSNLDITLTSDRTNKDFNLTWDTISYLTDNIKLEILKVNSTNGTTKLSTQTSTDNTGVLGYHITEDTTNATVTYIANAYVTSSDDGDEYLLYSESLDYRQEWEVFGLIESVMVSFIFIATIFFIGLTVSAPTGILLGIVGIILAYANGMIMVSMTGIASIIVVLVMILLRMRSVR